MKFSNFMTRGWGFLLPVLSRGEGFVHNDCPGGGVVFALFKSCPGGLSPRGMVMDEIDTCIKHTNAHTFYPER